MNPVASLLLRAKHWQLFALSLALALIELFVLRPPGSAAVVRGGVTALAVVFLLAWLWSVGSFLNSNVPAPLRLNMLLFYFTLAIPLLNAAFSFTVSEQALPATARIAGRVLAGICMLYDMGFVADLLVRAETDKPAPFGDVAAQALLIWLFPIGVWFVQPRINRLYAARTQGFTQGLAPGQTVGQRAVQLQLLHPRKPLVSLIAVLLLCSPIVPFVILSVESRDRNSPAWALVLIPFFALLAMLPAAGIVALVATIRRRAAVWSLIVMWIIVLLSVVLLFSMHQTNPYGG
ncbi:MAG: hypothetical protein WB680_12070 [Candidatus Acidiferrales bacterium]